MDRRKIDHERIIYVTVDFALSIVKNVAKGLFNELQKDMQRRNLSGNSPSEHLIETSKDLIARIDIPEIPKEDVIIDLSEEMLVIETDTIVNQRGRRNKFKIEIKLPKRIEVDNSYADIEDGVLTVTMPKKIKRIKYEVK